MIVLGIDGRLASGETHSGAGRYCSELLRALSKMDHGMSLRIYVGRENDHLRSPNTDIQVLPPRPFWTHLALAKALRDNPPSVFFSPVTQLPWRCPCPSLISVLDLAVRSHGGYFPWKKRLAMRLKTDHAIRRGSHFLAISEATAADISTYYVVGRERITVAPLGVSEAFFAEHRAVDRLPDLPERYVLYVGQLQPRKNLVRLIDAFERVCAQHPDLPHHLVLAGSDGWQHEDIHRATEASPVSDRIHRLGHIAEETLPGLVAHADALALVSLWEGFGLPVAEAMAAGTAVLASNCSSIPEVVGDAGVLVDPTNTQAIADGLARLLSDGNLRTACQNAGRIRAQRFRWENTAEAIVATVKNLV